MASENPEFGTTPARRLNQSRASAVLQSNLTAIKFVTAEAVRLNWASAEFRRVEIQSDYLRTSICQELQTKMFFFLPFCTAPLPEAHLGGSVT